VVLLFASHPFFVPVPYPFWFTNFAFSTIDTTPKHPKMGDFGKFLVFMVQNFFACKCLCFSVLHHFFVNHFNGIKNHP
jgi:hypothetical protein